MADIAINSPATVAVPDDYTIPGAQEILPKSVSAALDGTSATSSWYPCLQFIDPGGHVMASAISTVAVAAGGSASVTWFPGAEELETDTTASGTLIDSFFVDTRSATGATSAVTLTSGTSYLVTATGTWSYANHSLDTGSPEANALYPTPGSRSSTQVGSDPECTFAYYSGAGGAIGHWTLWQFNLGSGFAYTTPTDGTHAVPNSSHSYTYQVTGQGSALSAKFVDNPVQYGDNYGYVLVTIRTLGPTSVPGAGPDHAILRSSGGVSVWETRPDIVEADLSLSDNTTANVSTSKHGLTPKLPNNAAQYLDGTGAYTTPSGSSPLTTKGDLFGHSTVDARIPVGADGTILVADSTQTLGLKWGSGGGGTIGYEIGYTEITSNVSITSTTESSGTTIISPGALTFDGAPVLVTFNAVFTGPSPAGAVTHFCLFEGSTEISRLASFLSVSGQPILTAFAQYRFTPSAASHTYTVTAFVSSTTGSPVVNAGPGGTAAVRPAFVRFTKV